MRSLIPLVSRLVPLLLVLALVALPPAPALAQSAPFAVTTGDPFRLTAAADLFLADQPSAVLVAPAFASDHADLTQTVAVVRTFVVRDTTSPFQEHRMMRAKMKVSRVELMGSSETIHAAPVGRSGSYPADGSDEDNTFAKFSPSGSLSLQIANPALLGKIKPGDTFYVDFTPAT